MRCVCGYEYSEAGVDNIGRRYKSVGDKKFERMTIGRKTSFGGRYEVRDPWWLRAKCVRTPVGLYICPVCGTVRAE